MRVQLLGQEDPLEKEMTTHSSILAWKIPWIEEPGGYSPWQRSLQSQRGLKEPSKHTLKESQICHMKRFSHLLHIGRCKSPGLLKSFLSCASNYLGPVLLSLWFTS